MIRHRAVVNFIKGITEIIPFNENDNILSLTTLAFDIFGLETILPLTKGAKVVIGTEEERLNAEAAAAVLEKERITILQVTPSRLRVLISHNRGAAGLSWLDYLLVGGEAFPQTLLEKTRNLTRGKIYNMYGPTETTIWSTVKEVTGERALNIGKPIANTRVYIAAKAGHPRPVGIPGEMLIGGDGVSRGYINNPELTAEKFDHDLWDLQDYHDGYHRSYTSYTSYISHKSYIYRTGDLARWLPDGNIEFLGRMDHQVKIRGFRIELAEIEIQLQAHGHIREAVVLVNGEGENKSLWAYIVSERELNVGELRKYLSLKLPGYMIPSHFVQVEKIILTPNGKIDRKALMKYEGRQLGAGGTYVAPAAGIEKTVADLWKEVLQLDKVGIHDNFFDLGGNSLNIIQLNNRLKEVLKREIPVALMFRYLTIGSFTKYLVEAGGRKDFTKQKAEVSAALNRSRKIYENTVNRLRKGVKNG
jgi:acyl-CoA synthetase (AMP-forming)/AMP-acid ligase II/acyl carrier protein